MEPLFSRLGETNPELYEKDNIASMGYTVLLSLKGMTASTFTDLFDKWKKGDLNPDTMLLCLVMFDIKSKLDISKKIKEVMRAYVERAMHSYDIFSNQFRSWEDEPESVHDIRLILTRLGTIGGNYPEAFTSKSKL